MHPCIYTQQVYHQVAPWKGVHTCARATIAKLNHHIAHHAQVYGHCCCTLARLDADAATLDKYKILLKDHLKSSTALLNLNKSGSIHIQLSWICQTAGDPAGGTPESLCKCQCHDIPSNLLLTVTQSIGCIGLVT